MNFDSTDHALIAAAHARDHIALLALADKKREEGHDDFATLLAAGVNHGYKEPVRGYLGKNQTYVIDWRGGRGYSPRPVFISVLLQEPTDSKGVELQVPVHHPELREMTERLTGVKAPASEYWQGENPLWLTTPAELDALRAYSGDKPAKLPYEAVRHGRKGMAGVFKNEQGKYHLHILNSWGLPYSGPVGPFPSLDHALHEAEMHAGVEKEPVEETARQYQRAATTLAQQASK